MKPPYIMRVTCLFSTAVICKIFYVTKVIRNKYRKNIVIKQRGHLSQFMTRRLPEVTMENRITSVRTTSMSQVSNNQFPNGNQMILHFYLLIKYENN
jgi:hypothetical protein